MDIGSRPVSPPAAAAPRALVVDDDLVNRLVLAEQLATLGFEAVECENGRDAVAACRSDDFDMIFMDVMMPFMDGIEATRRIRGLPHGSDAPVVFLTALDDDDTLERCLAAGGDDFLTKPVNLRVLSARVGALQRRQALHRRLHRLTERERSDEALAQRILDQAVTAQNLARPSIVAAPWSSRDGGSAFHLSARAPSGDVHVLLGDFAGPGLAAAIAAVPAAEVFHAMVSKGFAPEQVLRAIDAKLCALLHGDLRLGVQYVVVQANLAVARIANCGLPPLAVRVPGAPVRLLPSASVALGVDADALLPGGFADVAITPGTRLQLVTDGDGETPAVAIELCCDAALTADARADGTAPDIAARPRERSGSWDFSLTLHGAQLREVDPVPLVLNHVGELLGDAVARAELFTIVTELFVNALDHGVLCLDSSLKRGADGFINYMQQRAARLAELDHGWVRIGLRARFADAAPTLEVCVADSGAGFDPAQLGADPPAGEVVTWGRGLKLLRKLCREVAIEDGGARTTVVYALDRIA